MYLQQVHGSSTHHDTSTGGGDGGTQQTGLTQQSLAWLSCCCPIATTIINVTIATQKDFPTM